MAVTATMGLHAFDLFPLYQDRLSKSRPRKRRLIMDPRYTSSTSSETDDIDPVLTSMGAAYGSSYAMLEPAQQVDYSSESSLPADVESLNFLFNNALRFFEPSFAATDGVMAQVPSMFHGASQTSHIRSAVNALAMERLGLDTQDASMLSQAQQEYGRTLLKVRDALGDPYQSRQDETLVTIHLLCHFEFLRSVTENIDFTHTHGDAIPLLLRHRGFDQLSSDPSRTMFLCFQKRLLLYCIDRWFAFEDMLGELSEIPEYPDNTGLRLMRIAREVNRIQTRINALRRASTTDRNNLLRAIRGVVAFAHEVDNRLQQWGASIEDVWRYSLADADDILFEQDRFADQVHVYPNVWIARIWNGWRTIRISLHGAVNELLNWSQAVLGADLPEERKRIAQITQAMVDEVCNTVHYHLGNRTTQDREPIAQFPTQGADDPYERHAMQWGWFHLLVPLRACYKAPALLPHQRQWIHRSLVRISRIARQSNNRPPPTSPPVLMTEQLPSNAFAFPMFITSESGQPVFAPTSTEMDFFQFENPTTSHMSTPAPSMMLPSQSSDYFTSAAQPRPSRSPEASASAARSPKPQVDLPFFNTTNPEQIKDPETQKKIRRDVMLHHMRTQDPKQREERQRKARAGSAARAASRREQTASASRDRRESAGEESSSAPREERKGSSKKSSSSRGKERAR